MADTKIDTLPSGKKIVSPNVSGGGGDPDATDVQFSASPRILGRATAGAGDGEELTGPQAGALIKLDDLASPDDNTDLDSSTSRHGLLKKLPGAAALFLNGAGNFVSTGLSTILDINNSETEVVNTTTETAIYSFEIPGGTIGVNGLLEFKLFGDYLNDSGSNKSIILRVYLGSDIVWEASIINLGSSGAARRAQLIECWLMNLGAENLNLFQINAKQNNITSSDNATADIGNPTGGMSQGTNTRPNNWWGSNHGLTVDTSASVTFSVTIEHSAAHANTSYIQRYAILMKGA